MSNLSTTTRSVFVVLLSVFATAFTLAAILICPFAFVTNQEQITDVGLHVKY